MCFGNMDVCIIYSLVIFSHVNQWQSVKWANKYKILTHNCHFRLRKLRSSYQGTKNVSIYAYSSGKILDVRKIAGVKDMTNIMSGLKTSLPPYVTHFQNRQNGISTIRYLYTERLELVPSLSSLQHSWSLVILDIHNEVFRLIICPDPLV